MKLGNKFDGKNFGQDGSGTELVTLQMPGKDLGEFLASMLGQRRSVTKELHYIFTIDLNWIINLVELISQRISAQNKGDLISFDAAISYKEGKRVELTNINQLKYYSDVSNDISTSIRINFTYLLNFPYKETPERQDIEFFASSAGTDAEYSSRGEESYKKLRKILIPLNQDKSVMMLEVRHTDLTWGEDVINLISNHVDASFTKTGGVWDTLRLITAASSPLLGLLMGSILIANTENIYRNTKLEILKNYSKVFENSPGTLQSIEQKLNVLFKYYQDMETSRGFGLVGLLLAMMSPIFVVAFLFLIYRIRSNSYVVLNKATEKFVLRSKKFKKIVVTTLLSGVTLSIVTGIISSSLYEKLPKIW